MIYENTPDYQEQLKKFNAYLEEEPKPENLLTVITDEADENGAFKTYQYIPISILSSDIFEVFNGLVQREIIDTSAFNGGSKSNVRWRVFHPIFQEWMNYDGVGFAPIEAIQPGQYKGSTKALKVADEKMALPLCASEGFKNAAKFCKRFGRDLNKDLDKVASTKGQAKEKVDPKAEIERVNIQLEKLKSSKAKK